MIVKHKEYLKEQIQEYAIWIIDYYKQNGNKKLLTELIEENLINRNSAIQFSSNLGHFHGHWNLDWLYIASFINDDYYSCKKVLDRINSKITNNKLIIFKLLDKSACFESRKLYLKNPNDINSEPIKFNAIELLNNYSNINRKIENWLPVVGTTNFGQLSHSEELIQCDKFEIIFWKEYNEVWNESKRCFEPTKQTLKERKERSKYIKSVITNKKGETISKLEDGAIISVKIDGKNYKRILDKQKKDRMKKDNLFGKLMKFIRE